MWHVNRIATSVFDAFFSVMESWPGWASLTVLSALTGVIALIAYKYTSNQQAIGRVHDDIKVALLAAKLFKDNIAVTLRSQGKLFGAATRLFLLSLQPLAVMIVPMVLLLAQMAPRYEWKPLRVGDKVEFYADLQGHAAAAAAGKPPVAIDVPEGVELLAGPTTYLAPRYKDYDEQQCAYARLRVTAPGRHQGTLRVGTTEATKEFAASDRTYARMSPIRAGSSFFDQLLFAVEKPAGKDEVIQEMWIEPVRLGSTPVFGLDWHWVIWWLILSMIIALAVKPFFNVKMW